mgnify:CR=1 FL=1
MRDGNAEHGVHPASEPSPRFSLPMRDGNDVSVEYDGICIEF